MNEQRAVLVDGRYNSDFHKGLVNAIARGLEAARNSGLGDSGIINRIANVVTHHLLTDLPETASGAILRLEYQRGYNDGRKSVGIKTTTTAGSTVGVEPEPGLDLLDRLHIRGVIVGMRQAAMDQHDYGLFMSPSRIRADAFRDVLIATGLADDEMVQEHEDDIEAVREQLARISAELKTKESGDGLA